MTKVKPGWRVGERREGKYSEVDKRKILLYATNHGLKAAHKKFNVSLCAIRTWLYPEFREKHQAYCRHKHNTEYKERRKLHYQQNKARIQARIKKYDTENFDRLKILSKKRFKERLIEDPVFRARTNLRHRFSRLIRKVKGTKADCSLKLLGCSLSAFKLHIEEKFKSGMSWDNYGKWEIDHIIPLSYFNLTDFEQQRIACHYTNLQPLWEFENTQKGNQLPHNLKNLILAKNEYFSKK